MKVPIALIGERAKDIDAANRLGPNVTGLGVLGVSQDGPAQTKD
jgi:hypothetical protein